jgi:quinol monooxygenase YgiN
MKFRDVEIKAFTSLFEERKNTIRSFEGCNHLELWQDAKDPSIFFTYSHWESEKHLDHYRYSEFFRDTWTKTKALFDGKPQAWSVNQKDVVK